jgi:hypothetical protein
MSSSPHTVESAIWMLELAVFRVFRKINWCLYEMIIFLFFLC